MLAAAANAHSESEDASDLDIGIVCNIEIANCWAFGGGDCIFNIYIFLQMLAAHTSTLEANSYNHILPNLAVADIEPVCNSKNTMRIL